MKAVEIAGIYFNLERIDAVKASSCKGTEIFVGGALEPFVVSLPCEHVIQLLGFKKARYWE